MSVDLKMIEVFVTDVSSKGSAVILADLLEAEYPGSRVSFDLEDKDRVLRMEGSWFDTEGVIETVRNFGHFCSVME